MFIIWQANNIEFFFIKMLLSRKENVLELIHLDVCGPLKVRIHSGALYFVTFIEDYSRKVWAFLLKTKDQILKVFKHFLPWLKEKQGRN